MTSTSTPKDVQVNTSLQSKQNSTIEPDKPLTSNLLGHQNKIADEIHISDSDEKELSYGYWLGPSVNQNVRKKKQYPIQHNSNKNNTYISSLDNDNRENQGLHWEQQMHDYKELQDEITEKVTNHKSKLIDNLENKFRQII